MVIDFERIKDVSDVSGTGNVADGVIFDDGQVVVHWLGTHSSINVYSSLKDVECFNCCKCFSKPSGVLSNIAGIICTIINLFQSFQSFQFS